MRHTLKLTVLTVHLSGGSAVSGSSFALSAHPFSIFTLGKLCHFSFIRYFSLQAFEHFTHYPSWLLLQKAIHVETKNYTKLAQEFEILEQTWNQPTNRTNERTEQPLLSIVLLNFICQCEFPVSSSDCYSHFFLAKSNPVAHRDTRI